MSDLNSILNIFNKITIQKIGEYLGLMADLYIRPVESWKRILNQRKTSNDYFVIYMLFFGLLIYIITWSFQDTIKIVFIHLLITLVPFVFLLLPFKFFSILWNKRLKANRLYRLFFVFQIQVFPFIHFPILIAKWAEVELPYLISSNLEFLFDLLIIIVVPLIIKLNVKRKLVWILCNYIFASFYLMCFNFALSSSNDFRKILNKAEYFKPEDEFNNLMKNYKKTDVYLSKNLLYILSKKENDEGRIRIDGTQFATLNTSDFLTEKLNNKFKKVPVSFIISKKPSILKNETPFKIYNEIYDFLNENNLLEAASFEPFSNRELAKIDSLRLDFNKRFYFDLKLMDSLKTNAIHKSNRDYANYVYLYLKQYDSIAKDTLAIKKIVQTKRPLHRLKFEDNKYLLIYYLDEKAIKYDLQGIIDRNINYYNKYQKSHIVSSFFYYPIFRLFHYKQEQFDYTSEFKNISFTKKQN